ncbi:MAG: type III secretion fhipep protein [Thermomicrobiales bacterium]|nr:type III secretion fhipep protein [Thermomicrobiales bacterium]
MASHGEAPRPAVICQQLLQAMSATEGRRRRRKRNTTPDALGMEIKQGLLEAVVADDPDPDAFDEWLYTQVQAAGGNAGPTRAMARQVREEWAFAVASAGFRHWLEAGAPSDDAR